MHHINFYFFIPNVSKKNWQVKYVLPLHLDNGCPQGSLSKSQLTSTIL